MGNDWDWACSVLTTASDVTEIDKIVVVGVATLHWLFKVIVPSLRNWGLFLRCVGAFTVQIGSIPKHRVEVTGCNYFFNIK